MGRATRDLHRRKSQKKLSALRGILSRCDDRAFLQLAWAVNMLQSDFTSDVRRYLIYPAGAATTKMDSEFSIHKWDIETVLALLLDTAKYVARPGESRLTYRLDRFDTMAAAVNLLRDAEDHEAGAYLDRHNVMLELHRIGHRQFGWQRGFATTERLYRFVYVYGQGACASYFQQTYGITLDDFLRVGFMLFTQLHRYPWTRAVAIEQLDIDHALIERALPLFSRSLAEIRSEATSLAVRAQGQGGSRLAYLPSALRRFPVITDPRDNSYIAPLPQLIMFRMTAGLYYDIAAGPQQLITEANNRFEDYVRKLVSGFFPRFEVLPSQRYGTKKAAFDSPDVLVRDGKDVVVVIECKATKLTYEAQYAEHPMQAAARAYGQLVKGIAQLWKFFSHVRREIYTGPAVSAKAHGVLLTMEAWLQGSDALRSAAQDEARNLVKDDPDVIDEDMRPVVFCSMQDLADVMFISSEDQLLKTLEHAATRDYRGWGLREIRREVGGEEGGRDFPFQLEELLPWWGRLQRDRPAD